eukprot:1160992-Pelagomonas_calceolata.AAC.12
MKHTSKERTHAVWGRCTGRGENLLPGAPCYFKATCVQAREGQHLQCKRKGRRMRMSVAEDEH